MFLSYNIDTRGNDMKAKQLLSIIQNNPEAAIVMRSTPYDDNSLNEVDTVRFYRQGDKVIEGGENFTNFIDDETSEALVDLIVIS